ncbi:phenylacetate--CoA ligase family protein [Actinokineospora sp. HUAS TT18]|uniref:phenylacetate--CoA ligase family protein n=1 Tax=Actinokineospora sp. HUAS TT18 TaxID=3447451 RepID=UPI003F51B87D
MIWHHEDRTATLRTARQEIGNHSEATPDSGFYQRKLADVWARAAKSAAYAGIGEYSAAAFAALPVTPREALKARPLDFATVAPGEGLRYYETTGSTGVPTPTPRLAEDIIWNTVSVAHAWQSVLTAEDRVISLLPSDVVPVGDLVSQVCDYLDIAHVRAYPFATGICDWDRLIQLWRGFRPTAVFLAPGVALQWTRLVKQRGLLAELSADVRSLLLLGEVNTAPFRHRLGRWWDAAAFDASYGSTETGTLASTCAAGNQHLLPAATFFELATPDGLVPIGEAAEGQLVVTPLNAYARPLLRLNTGDTVSIGADCPCGRATPLVTVHGRVSDGLSVRGVALAARGVEEVVYGSTEATGYLIEVDADGGFARLLLERDVDAARAAEPAQAEALQRASQDRLDVRWDQVAFVNTLPGNTKSGASQKSWKRSNIRILENV